MNTPVQYITNESGERVGVLLDITDYQQLMTPVAEDSELLTNVSLEELEALAESRLAPATQIHLDDLLARQADGILSKDEIEVLDSLLAQIDQLTLLKSRAAYTLSVG